MSSAFYPQGMSSYNNRLPQGGYKSWKYYNPVGVTAGTVRPLTNKDPGNNYPAAFGKARPIKHARKGAMLYVPVEVDDPYNTTYNEYIAMDRNKNRQVASSTRGTLVKQMMDNPGSYSITNSVANNPDQRGICVVSDYSPNPQYLTENPEPQTTSPPLCCNAEKKARRRVLPASTLLKKNYFTTLEQYRENRCQTFDQRAFNFVSPAPNLNPQGKPGGPEALANSNTYFANCQPNGEIAEATESALVARILLLLANVGIVVPPTQDPRITTFAQLLTFIKALPDCANTIATYIYDSFMANPYSGMPPTGPSNFLACKLVVYKPNNYQFAQQGGVTASTLTFKKNVTTIQKNLYNISKNNQYIYKNKAPPCDPALYTYNQNTTSCSSIRNLTSRQNSGFFFKTMKLTR
jgi:hypothetical protein